MSARLPRLAYFHSCLLLTSSLQRLQLAPWLWELHLLGIPFRRRPSRVEPRPLALLLKLVALLPQLGLARLGWAQLELDLQLSCWTHFLLAYFCLITRNNPFHNFIYKMVAFDRKAN